MIDHFTLLLDAYLDNELPPSKIQAVEQHLLNCLNCQAELQKRRRLVDLLHKVPPVKTIRAEHQFIANVSSQLTGRPSIDWLTSSIFKFRWQVIPVSLLIAMAFIKTVSLMGTMIEIIPGASGMIIKKISWLPFNFTIMDPYQNFLWFFGLFRILNWNWITGIAAFIMISLIYISWLAVWWIRSESINEHRMIYKGVN